MFETIITIILILAAAASLVYGLYRIATGKSKCSGCSTCPDSDCKTHSCNCN